MGSRIEKAYFCSTEVFQKDVTYNGCGLGGPGLNAGASLFLRDSNSFSYDRKVHLYLEVINMEKMKKAWTYVKEHKKEILIGVGVTVSGVVLYKVCKTEPRITDIDIDKTISGVMGGVDMKHLEIQDFGVGCLTDVMRYESGSTELWLTNVEIGKIGELGEEIASKIPDIPENAHIWMLMNITE